MQGKSIAFNRASQETLAHMRRCKTLPPLRPGEHERLMEQADAVLDRLAKTPDNTEATLVADVLFGKLRTLA